jgi:hypothetical protein
LYQQEAGIDTGLPAKKADFLVSAGVTVFQGTDVVFRRELKLNYKSIIHYPS